VHTRVNDGRTSVCRKPLEYLDLCVLLMATPAALPVAHDVNGLSRQTSDNGPIEQKGVFPGLSNGRGPPTEKEKGRTGDNLGRPHSHCTPSIAHPENPGNSAWRVYYDNARGNVDEAIKALYRAHGDGLIGDEEAAAIDAALRAQQTSLVQRPVGLARVRLAGKKSTLTLGWPRRRPRRMPDRERSRERARVLGGSSSMPPQVRSRYTECERAALTIVAREVKRQGVCDLSIGQIAAEAGVCVRTAQNAIAEAVRNGHLKRTERPQQGRKNLTNVLQIVSLEWLTWIKRGPIGCKDYTATKISDSRRKEKSPTRNIHRMNR
jgi:hypothetical protein